MRVNGEEVSRNADRSIDLLRAILSAILKGQTNWEPLSGYQEDRTTILYNNEVRMNEKDKYKSISREKWLRLNIDKNIV